MGFKNVELVGDYNLSPEALKAERRIIRAALKAELLELYNETWRQRADPVLTAAEMTDLLQWSLLEISASEIVPVTFSYEAG